MQRDSVATLLSHSHLSNSNSVLSNNTLSQPMTSRYGGSNMHGILTNSEFIPKSTHVQRASITDSHVAMSKPSHFTKSFVFGDDSTVSTKSPKLINGNQENVKPVNERVTRSQVSISHDKHVPEPFHSGKSIIMPNKNSSHVNLSTGLKDDSENHVQKTTIKLSETTHKNTSVLTSSNVGFGASSVEPILTARGTMSSNKNHSKVFTNSRSPNAKIMGKMHVRAVEHPENTRPQTAKTFKKNQSQIEISSVGMGGKTVNSVNTGKVTSEFANRKNQQSTSTGVNINGNVNENSKQVKRVRSEMDNILQQNPPTPSNKQTKTFTKKSPSQNILSWN